MDSTTTAHSPSIHEASSKFTPVSSQDNNNCSAPSSPSFLSSMSSPRGKSVSPPNMNDEKQRNGRPPPPLLPPTSAACFPLSLLYGQPNSYLFVGSTPFMPLPPQGHHPSADLNRSLLFPNHSLHNSATTGFNAQDFLLKEKAACLDFARNYQRARSSLEALTQQTRPPMVPHPALCGAGLPFPATSSPNAFDKWRSLDLLKMEDKLRSAIPSVDTANTTASNVDVMSRPTSETAFSDHDAAESPKSIDLTGDSMSGDAGPPRWDSFFRLFNPAGRKWTPVPGQVPCCPVCGITLTHSQIAEHFQVEMEKLGEFYSCRRWLSQERNDDDPTDQHLDRICRPPPSYGHVEKRSPLSRWETYIKVRGNRHHRLSDKRRTPNDDPSDLHDRDNVFCGRKRKSSEEEAQHQAPGSHNPFLHPALSNASSPLDLKTDPRKIDPSKSPILKVEVSETYAQDGTDGPSPDQEVPRAGSNEGNLESETHDAATTASNETCNGSTVTSTKDSRLNCVVCQEPYTNPVVSICCWHVHCESCWLQSMTTKHACPQCETITSPGDLRKIHL